MATTNYGLEEINKNTDVLSPDPINRNTVKIDTQMKANERAIQTVAEQVANINVTTDVEEVVNRRLNTDRSKSLLDLLYEVRNSITTAINGARDNIKAHVTSEHTSSKSTLNTAIVSARDSVNSNVDTEHVSTRKAVTDARDNVNSTLGAKIDSLKQSVSSGKTVVANSITGKGVNTSTTATFATMASNIEKIPTVTSSNIPTCDRKQSIGNVPQTYRAPSSYGDTTTALFFVIHPGTLSTSVTLRGTGTLRVMGGYPDDAWITINANTSQSIGLSSSGYVWVFNPTRSSVTIGWAGTSYLRYGIIIN